MTNYVHCPVSQRMFWFSLVFHFQPGLPFMAKEQNSKWQLEQETAMHAGTLLLWKHAEHSVRLLPHFASC